MAGFVVVGGGLAGLVCAWRLQRAGHDVEILELEPEAGGRARTEQRDGFAVPRGAGFVTAGQRTAVGVATALGLQEEIVPLGGPGESAPGAILHRGRFEACELGPGVLRTRLLSASAKLRLGRLAAEILRRRERLDPVRPERAARLEDGEGLSDFLARTAGEAARDRLLAPVLGFATGSELDDLCPAFGLLMLRSLAAGAQPITLRGGLGRLSAELAARVTVRPGCEVFSIETEQGGARVRYRGAGRERCAVADGVVVAVPGPTVPLLCPKLTPDERGFFESIRYSPSIQVGLLLDEPPRGLRPFGAAFARAGGAGLRTLVQMHAAPDAAPEGTGLLVVELGEGAVHRLARRQDGEIATFALDAIARTPLGPLAPRDVVVRRWLHARPIFGGGALSRLEHFGVRMDRSPRMAFAGDYLIAPTVEGALASGMEAAAQLHLGCGQ